MQNSTGYIVRRLQEILAREAASHFKTTVLNADFKQYIVELTKIVDWEDDFIDNVYKLYLEKVTSTGEQLSHAVTSSTPLHTNQG